MKKTLLTIVAATLLIACSRTSPEQQVIDDAAEALGGKARIQQIKTLTLEGEGDAPNLGQNVTTDSPLPNWKVTEYRRAIEVGNDRMRVKQVRNAQFLLASSSVQQLDQGIDGDLGYNVAADGMVTRTATTAVRDRRVEMLHHPITLIRAALDPGAKVGNRRSHEGVEQVE